MQINKLLNIITKNVILILTAWSFLLTIFTIFLFMELQGGHGVFWNGHGNFDQQKSRESDNAVSIISSESATEPALNLQNRAGMFSPADIKSNPLLADIAHAPALVVHNYNDAPAVQIDNVGSNTGLIIKRARNPQLRDDRDEHYVGQGPFIQFTLSGDGTSDPVTSSPRTVTTFQKDGNIYLNQSGETETARKIWARGLPMDVGSISHPLILRGKKHIIAKSPIRPPVRQLGTKSSGNRLIAVTKDSQLLISRDGIWENVCSKQLKPQSTFEQ